MFLKLSKNRIVDISHGSIRRGLKGEAILTNASGVPEETNLSFDDIVEKLRQMNALIDPHVVQFTEDGEEDDFETQQQEDDRIYGLTSESSNLNQDGSSSQTKEEIMKSDHQRELEARNTHARKSESEHLAASERVYSVIRRLYNPITIAPATKLSTIEGYDNDEFIGALGEGTDFDFDEDSVNKDHTVGDVISLLERKQIEANTVKVQEEHPVEDVIRREEELKNLYKDDGAVVERSSTTQVLAGVDEAGHTPEELGLGPNTPESELNPDVETTKNEDGSITTESTGTESNETTDHSETEVEEADVVNGEDTFNENLEETSDEDIMADENSTDDDAEHSDEDEDEIEVLDDKDDDDAVGTVTAEQIVAAIQEELGEDDDDDTYDPNKNVGEWIDGTETTLEDIVDRIANDFEVDIDESEVFDSTTVTQLADLVNAKKIAE